MSNKHNKVVVNQVLVNAETNAIAVPANDDASSRANTVNANVRPTRVPVPNIHSSRVDPGAVDRVAKVTAVQEAHDVQNRMNKMLNAPKKVGR